MRDGAYAVRTLLRTPSFTLAAILAIALGIGAGTAVFSVVDRILFRSLPYPDDGRLVSLGMVAPIAQQEFLLGYDYLDWRAARTPFVDRRLVGRGKLRSDGCQSGASPLRVCGLTVPADSSGFSRSRAIISQRRRTNRGAPEVALISYGLWQSRFGGDRAIVGKQFSLDGRPAVVSGVLPAQFELPTLAPADLLLTQRLDETEQAARKTQTLLYAVGRLRPGATLEQARAGAAAALREIFERCAAELSQGRKSACASPCASSRLRIRGRRRGCCRGQRCSRCC